MKAFETSAKVEDFGQVRIANVPFAPGTEVKVTVDFPRDPKDAPFLAAALATDADFLITGGKDLLEARDIVKTRIVTVAEFSAESQV